MHAQTPRVCSVRKLKPSASCQPLRFLSLWSTRGCLFRVGSQVITQCPHCPADTVRAVVCALQSAPCLLVRPQVWPGVLQAVCGRCLPAAYRRLHLWPCAGTFSQQCLQAGCCFCSSFEIERGTAVIPGSIALRRNPNRM